MGVSGLIVVQLQIITYYIFFLTYLLIFAAVRSLFYSSSPEKVLLNLRLIGESCLNHELSRNCK